MKRFCVLLAEKRSESALGFGFNLSAAYEFDQKHGLLICKI